MAINDVLPLKAAQREAITNFKCFWRPGRQQPNFDGFIYVHYAAPLIWLASAPFSSSRLAKFGLVPFAMCNAWQRSRTQNLRRLGEMSDPVVTHLWPKVHEVVRRCRRLILANVLVQLSMLRFVRKMFVVKSRSRRKTEQMYKCFLRSIFLGGTTSTFLQQVVSAI